MSTPGNPKPLPPAGWFASGEIDRRKFDEYLLSPTHPEGKHKLRLWESIFGIGVGNGARLEQLIRNQVGGGVVSERAPREDTRRFGVLIEDFEGPSGRGPVLTAWASDHGDYRELKPRLVTALPVVK
ncbi:MAG: hypothetical protein H0U55_02840 [Rubrobacteraceae bacterium]|nr:hypothetical protein [Rubrobacteraceae bacterium]